MVFFHHLVFLREIPTEFGFLRVVLLIILKGSVGVDLFFGISGFLITSRLISEFHHNGSISIRNFYIRRAFRIIPPIIFFLAIVTVLKSFGLPISALEIGASLLFFRNFVFGSWATAHFWSLSVEEHFYAVWPVLFLLLYKTKHRFLITAGIAFLLGIWRHLVLSENIGVIEVIGSLSPYRTDVRLTGLIWGAAFAMAFGRRSFEYTTFSHRLRNFFPLFFFMALACCWARFPFSAILFPALIPLMIVSKISSPQSLVFRILELPLLRWIGKRSYSLYIWQQLACMALPNQQALNVVELIIRMGLLVIVSMISYSWVELPLVAMGHRLVRKQTPQPIDAPSQNAA